jgi:hypothetical protein
MHTVEEVLQHVYRERLKNDGIPLDRGKRTAEQQDTAQMEFWATMVEVNAATILTQDALEK